MVHFIVLNNKIKIVLAAVILVTLAIYGYVWHQSKVIFEQVINEFITTADDKRVITHKGVTFSHGFLSHQATIKDLSMEEKPSSLLIHGKGNNVVKSNLLFSKFENKSEGETVISNSVNPSEIYAIVKADNIISTSKHNLSFNKAIQMIFGSFNKKMQYAENNFLVFSKEMEEKIDNLNINSNSKTEIDIKMVNEDLQHLKAIVKLWLKNVKYMDIECNNIQIEIPSKVNITAKRIYLNASVVKYDAPNAKLKIDTDIENLIVTQAKDNDEFFKKLQSSYLYFPSISTSYKHTLFFDITYKNKEEFDFSTDCNYTLITDNFFNSKGNASFMLSCLQQNHQCAFGLQYDDVTKVTEKYYTALKSYFEQVATMMAHKQNIRLTESEINKSAELLTPKLHEYKDISSKIDVSGIFSYDKGNSPEALRSLEIKAFSLATPPYTYGLHNMQYKMADEKGATLIKGDIIIDAVKEFCVDLGNYAERIMNAFSILNPSGKDKFQKVKADKITSFLNNVFAATATELKNNKLIITMDEKEGKYYIGKKTLLEFMKLIADERTKIFSELDSISAAPTK